jgi:hypothetical protein
MNIKSDASVGALARTNQEIRQKLESAEAVRQRRDSVDRPLRYLDRVIADLERLHLRGLTVLPDSFLPTLNGVKPLLPAGVVAPERWRRRIAAAIDCCFELQEELLQVRQSSRLRAAA